MYEIEKQVIETVAGPYTVRFIVDEDAQQPDWAGSGLVLCGDNRHFDVTHGEHAEEIASVVSYHRRMNAYNGNIYDSEIRSAAAIARYIRLKYGVNGVVEIDQQFRPSEPSPDRGQNFDGLAWEEPEVSGQYDEVQALRNVKTDLEAWHAWAEGDVFGWVVEDPSGDEVGSCWGYYGYDRERDYTLSEAKDAAENDAQERVEVANLVGAGIVGLI